MSTPEELADRVTELATAFLADSTDEIANLAAGDGRALYEAAQIVRARASDVPPSAHSAEHLAFSLLTAAHELIRHRAADAREPPS